MHKIKRQARREGWYTQGSSASSSGIFGSNFWTGRYRARPAEAHDEENQLRPSRTENDAVVLQDRRRADGDDGGIVTLHRSSTAPDASVAEFHRPPNSGTFPQGPPEETDEPIEHKEPRVHFSEPEATEASLVIAPPSMGRAPRVRRFQGLTNSSTFKTSKTDDDEKKKRRPRISIRSQLKSIFGTWSSLLFLFVPIGFALNYTHQSPVAIFVINFFAIIPSTAVLGFAVEEFNSYVGDKIGALVSMSFSNCVQLISSIFLLKSRQIGVLRSSLLGGILQSLLVMTGLAFLCGGIRRQEQRFNPHIAQTISMLLMLAVLSLTIPTVAQLWAHTSPAGIIAQSRGTAVVIMMSYVLWLVFQLKTNRSLFQEPSPKTPVRPSLEEIKSGEAARGFAVIGAVYGATAGGNLNQTVHVQESPLEDEEPSLDMGTSLVTLVVFTALLAFNVQFATDSVQGIMAEHNVSEMFMGIVVLPILSNDPDTISTALRDEMDTSISLTLERCMQTALMVVPLIVLIAWGAGIDDMTLDFDGFSVAALFASIIIVTYVVQEGKSNWLTGALLLKVFVIIALASFYIEQ